MSDWTAAQVTLNNEGVVVDSNNPLPVTISSGGASGGATSDNQVEMIAQLDELIASTDLQTGNITTIAEKATAILNELQDDISDKRLTVRLDQVNDNLFYVGKALIGSIDSDSTWQIVRYTQTGTILKSEYANGSEVFNQVWDDRTTLTYI
jgi:hypothetical protein